MRPALLVLLAVWRRRAAAPPPVASKAPPGLPPLGPCPASSWRPEAPSPTTSAKVSMVLLAVQRMGALGRQATIYSAESGRAPSSSASTSARRRSGSTTTGRASTTGDAAASINVPWSAAFISWDIGSAGVPRDLFCPDQRHTIYVERMVERARRPGAGLHPLPADAAPARGRRPSAPRARAAAPPSTISTAAPATATSWSRARGRGGTPSAATSATR